MKKESVSNSLITFEAFYLYWAINHQPDWLEVPDFHYEIANFLADYINWDNDSAVLQVCRGGSKSTMVGLYIVWRLVCNPKLHFLVLSGTHELAITMVRQCRSIIRRHPLATHLIPPSHEKEWSQHKITVNGNLDPRVPSIKSAGINGNFTGNRADVLIYDDVEVPRNSGSANKREELRANIAEAATLLRPNGKTLFVGTPHTFETIYREQIDLNNSSLEIPMCTEIEGEYPNYKVKTIWPEYFTEDYVKQKIRETRTKAKFLSQYQLVPTKPEDTVLDPELINTYDGEIEITSVCRRPVMKINDHVLASVSAFWDPALSKANRDDSVVAIVYTDTEGRYYIHRTIEVKGSLDEQCEQVRDIAIQYHLPSVRIETNGVGGFVPARLMTYLKPAGVGTVEFNTTQNKADKLIGAFEGPMHGNYLYAHKSVMRSKFRGQLRDFTPKKMNRKNDYIDAAGSAILNEPVRIRSNMIPHEHSVNSNWRQYAETTTITVDKVTFE